MCRVPNSCILVPVEGPENEDCCSRQILLQGGSWLPKASSSPPTPDPHLRLETQGKQASSPPGAVGQVLGRQVTASCLGLTPSSAGEACYQEKEKWTGEKTKTRHTSNTSDGKYGSILHISVCLSLQTPLERISIIITINLENTICWVLKTATSVSSEIHFLIRSNAVFEKGKEIIIKNVGNY